MTDIIDRLKEPEAHYPGNFDTPKRANAMLSCLCQEAMEEIESLRRELAASQAREQQLREAIRDVCCDPDGNVCIGLMGGCYADKEVLEEALALPQDTTALEAMIAKAGEVMRERCRKVAFDMAYADSMAVDVSQTIRAIPGVTLKDIK